MTIIRREGPPRPERPAAQRCEHDDVWEFAEQGRRTGKGWCTRCGAGVVVDQVAEDRERRQAPVVAGAVVPAARAAIGVSPSTVGV